mmetsp:Transcript_28805/g.44273  ORF Transcript_28805/g.44273 Transcript_28805/m.44273 type:complete len:283 (+) Transcript_28805:778-1626(+)
MLGCLFNRGENTGGFHDVVGTSITPLNVGGVHFTKDLDGLSVYSDLIVASCGNRSRVLTVDSIVLQHVFHVVSRDERIVDGDNVDHRVILGGAHNKTANTSKSVNTDVDRLKGVVAGLAVDNISELRLEGGTSNKETINIRLFRKSWGSCTRCRTSVKDTSVLSDIGTGDFTEVLTNGSMCVLGLFGGGGEASSNSPDGFVSDNNTFPVFLCEDIGICLDLREDILVSGACLTSLKGFTTACHDRESLVKSVLGLGSNLSIGFALSATFRVSNNGPLNSHIG